MTDENAGNGDNPDSRNEDLERYGRFRVRRRGEGREGEHLAPNVELHESVQGSKPGSRYYRLTPRERQRLRQVAPGEFEATPAGSLPTTALGRTAARLRRVFIGRPLATAELPHQRVGKIKALAIYSSDALSSVAYATEGILGILILAAARHSNVLSLSIPISVAIAVLTVVVVISYRQTIRAYPNGGGAYIVAHENLGIVAGLIAGSALFVDYIMTVSVSIASGVQAITSAEPGLLNVRVELAIGCIALITLANLRGIRESGTIFAIPTYFFIVSFATMLGVGFVRVALGHHLHASPPPDQIEAGTEALGIFLVLKAFSSGCAALTGIEAVANGVPNFKAPEAKNAATTQAWMAVILATFFLGTSVLANHVHALPSETESVVAQIARTVFGHNIFFYSIQVSTALILVLAANTSFADLPMLSSVMARDNVMPRQFAFRGDRLSFSNGIFVLGVAASIILAVFNADVFRLIPLYAFGVFTAFTFSQSGMVVHWWRNREKGWRLSMIINGTGATATLVVAIVVGATKFLSGAWISILIMFFMVLFLAWVRRHYERVEQQLDPGPPTDETVARYSSLVGAGRTQKVIIPVDEINRAVLRPVAYARSLSDDVTAIHITDDRERGEALRRQWEEFVLDTPIVVIESPYRSLVEPILAYVDAMDRTSPGNIITVVLPEFLTARPWERILHNQLSQRLKKALMTRPNTVVVDVPYRLTR